MIPYYNRRVSANFLRKYEFELRFNRSPKEWSLEKLYDLYLLAKERSDKRSLDFTNHINKIIDLVPENGHGYHYVYFNSDGRVYKYEIRKSDYGGWAYSTNRVEFSEDVVKAREEKIDFILSNELQFELGEEMRRLEKMRSHFHRRVFDILNDLVSEKLTKKFKDVKNFDVPKVLRVKIKNQIFYVSLDKHSRDSYYDYKKFEITGQQDSEIIEFND